MTCLQIDSPVARLTISLAANEPKEVSQREKAQATAVILALLPGVYDAQAHFGHAI